MFTTIFISDLHLSEHDPRSFELFHHFLDSYAHQARELYILGDLFEVWVGDDDLTPFHQAVINLLDTLTQKGVQVFLMHGNRDFLLGERFAKLSHCTIIPDPYLVRLSNQNILLTHGDQLCSDDKEYAAYRKFVHIHVVQRFFLSVPLGIRRGIVTLLRQYSQKRSQSKTAIAFDVNPQAVERQFRLRPANVMIHGHTHLPGRHKSTIDGQPSERIVLGAWYQKGNALIWKEQQKEWLWLEFDV